MEVVVGKTLVMTVETEVQGQAKRREHDNDGTLGYTFVPFSIGTYGRQGVEGIGSAGCKCRSSRDACAAASRQGG
jgi:hypothetical protein